MKWFFAIFFSFSFLFLTVFGINCFYGYLFPIKFLQEVEVASERFDIDKSKILSMINVESHFNEKAISAKGAVGLMQVLPSTAQEVAQKLNMKSFDLKNPKDNIVIGTSYLVTLIEKFKDFDVALCAYNAGPANVAKWLKDEDLSVDGETLKKIPFYETREYLEKIQKNLRYYNKKMH